MNSVYSTVLVSLCLSLVGCNTIAPPRPPVDDSCRMSLKTAGGWAIAGVEIPLGKLAPNQQIKIGKATYNPDEAYALTETAELFEQMRLQNCALINSKDPRAAEMVGKSLDIMGKFAVVARTTNDPKAVLEAAAIAKSEIKETTKALPLPSTSSADAGPPRGDIKQELPNPTGNLTRDEVVTKLPRLPLDPSALSDRLDSMQTQIKTLSEQMTLIGAAPRSSRIEITGFPLNATSLPGLSRQELATNFESALKTVPAGRNIRVLIVGYADSSGSYDSNLGLGLRRATGVQEFLQRQSFRQSFESHALSGGIEKGALGRHVAIYVTTQS